MTINEILNNEKEKEFSFNIVDEDLINAINEVLEEEMLLEKKKEPKNGNFDVNFGKKYNDIKRKHTYQYGKYANLEYREGNPKFSKGREGLVTRIYNLLQKKGMSRPRSVIRSELANLNRQWKGNKEQANFIKPIEKGSSKLGFNPKNYENGNPSDKSTYKAEDKGRAYFFKAFCDEMVRRFSKKDEASKSNKGTNSKKTKQDLKIEKRERKERRKNKK